MKQGNGPLDFIFTFYFISVGGRRPMWKSEESLFNFHSVSPRDSIEITPASRHLYLLRDKNDLEPECVSF